MGSTLTTGAYANAAIEISHGTTIIIISCNPSYIYRFTNQLASQPGLLGKYTPTIPGTSSSHPS